MNGELPKDLDGWQAFDGLGGGGQGTVYLARSVEAVRRREQLFAQFVTLLSDTGNPLDTIDVLPGHARRRRAFSNFLDGLGFKDPAPELGAVKVFHIPESSDAEAEKAAVRLDREVTALRTLPHPNVLMLRYANPAKRFMVTEYHQRGPLSRNPQMFRGDATAALTAFLGLVDAIRLLHANNHVHRDIKPDNIFVADDRRLILGDFGIVFYVDEANERWTDTYERVGTREWMAPWVNTGQRIEDVGPRFDLFALGKVLWAMISGQRQLPYWYHNRPTHPQYNLERMFPVQPEMALVNALLDHCIVEHEEECVENAEMLYGMVHEALLKVTRHASILADDRDRPCRVCVRGTYRPLPHKDDYKLGLVRNRSGGQVGDVGIWVRPFACDQCGHLEMFFFPPDRRPKAWGPAS